MKNSSLKEIFIKFDTQKKGRMGYDSFTKMIKVVGKDINDDQIRAAFDLIDQDGSKTVQYGELENYYTKVNGILPDYKKKGSFDQNQHKMEE